MLHYTPLVDDPPDASLLFLMGLQVLLLSGFWWSGADVEGCRKGGGSKQSKHKQCHMKSKDVRRCHIMSLCNYLCSEVETC